MLIMRSNASKLITELGALTRGPNSIYNKAGAALVSTLLDEFDVLVRETPQWTGTTAASWEIGFQDQLTGDVRTQPDRSRKDALSRGSEPACGVAMDWARLTLAETNLGLYAIQDIIVSNSAPGFETAEEGPVRPENTPPGALKRFEGRVAAMVIEPDFYKV